MFGCSVYYLLFVRTGDTPKVSELALTPTKLSWVKKGTRTGLPLGPMCPRPTPEVTRRTDTNVSGVMTAGARDLKGKDPQQ